MRVMVVGATGTIGQAVARAVEDAGHEVVRVGRTSGEHQVDLADPASIRALYAAVDDVGAVVCCAGSAAFGPVQSLDEDDYEASLGSKLMGQVNLVRLGMSHLAPGGSFTLTTGTLAQDPTPGTAAVAMASGAVEAWVRAAALDLHQHRVNVVSPPWVKETMDAMGLDSTPGVPAAELAEVYLRALTGDMSGETLYVP